MKRLALKKSHLISLLIFIVTYIWSKFIFDFYTAGDQIAYNWFFNESLNKNLAEVYAWQKYTLSASEPGFSMLIYLTNSFFSKSTLMSFSNALLSVLFYQFIKDRKYAWLILIFFLLNYYTSVIFFAAERLKFAVIALLIIYKVKKLYWRELALFIPSLFHFQYLLILPIIYGRTYLLNPNFSRTTIRLPLLVIGIFAALFFLFLFGDVLLTKLQFYSGKANFGSIAKSLILGGILMTVSSQKRFDLFVALYFCTLVLLLGGERVIFMEVIYILLIVKFKDIYRFSIFSILSIYFALKTFDFYDLVFNCSQGFLSLVDPCF